MKKYEKMVIFCQKYENMSIFEHILIQIWLFLVKYEHMFTLI